MKKTQKVLDCLKFIDNQDPSSEELERLIEELADIQEGKQREEEQNYMENESDKQESLNQLNYR